MNTGIPSIDRWMSKKLRRQRIRLGVTIAVTVLLFIGLGAILQQDGRFKVPYIVGIDDTHEGMTGTFTVTVTVEQEGYTHTMSWEMEYGTYDYMWTPRMFPLMESPNEQVLFIISFSDTTVETRITLTKAEISDADGAGKSTPVGMRTIVVD